MTAITANAGVQLHLPDQSCFQHSHGHTCPALQHTRTAPKVTMAELLLYLQQDSLTSVHTLLEAYSVTSSLIKVVCCPVEVPLMLSAYRWRWAEA